jgi:S-methylmethionine-dependent homocysteine/selenocysteine methylase
VAWEAAHAGQKDVLVAGCLPPLTTAYENVDVREAELQQPIYNEIVAALLPNVDLFLCETMATEAQTWAAASAASASGKPFWVCGPSSG